MWISHQSSVCRPGWSVFGSFNFGDYFCTVNLSFRTLLLIFCRVICVSFGPSCSDLTLWICFWHWYIVYHTILYYLAFIIIFLNHLLYSRSRVVSLDWFLTFPLEDWVCTAFNTHLQFRGRVSGVNFGPFCILPQFNPYCEVSYSSSGNCGSFTVTSVTLITFNSIFEDHLSVTRISCWSVFAVLARMANLWLRTMDSMNSEEHSQTRIPVSVLHHIHHLCRCLLRWIPFPHTFRICHPQTGLRQYRRFVWHRLLQWPLPDLTCHIHRILQAYSSGNFTDAVVFVLRLWLLTRYMWLRWISCVHNCGTSDIMIWDWGYSLLLPLLMLKTSYDPSCYTSNRHVLHMRSAYRSWSLNTQTCAAQEKGIQELESELAQRSLTNLQGTLIFAWLMSSGSLTFRRIRHVRLSLSRTIIL